MNQVDAVHSAAAPVARTPGAVRAGPDDRVFDFSEIDAIQGGPTYSPVFGGVVEGDRMIVGLMRAPAGKMGDPHNHPNEQWIYVLEGRFEIRIHGQTHVVGPKGLIYIPAEEIHQGGATPEADCVFFTCKDGSHGLQGNRVPDGKSYAHAPVLAANAKAA
jgi:quercetin dioxygenase-like cupin family protein